MEKETNLNLLSRLIIKTEVIEARKYKFILLHILNHTSLNYNYQLILFIFYQVIFKFSQLGVVFRLRRR
jgi:hypothetical protein